MQDDAKFVENKEVYYEPLAGSVTDLRCSHQISKTSVCYQSARTHNHMESICFINNLLAYQFSHTTYSDGLCRHKRPKLVIIMLLISITKGQACWLTQG